MPCREEIYHTTFSIYQSTAINILSVSYNIYCTSNDLWLDLKCIWSHVSMPCVKTLTKNNQIWMGLQLQYCTNMSLDPNVEIYRLACMLKPLIQSYCNSLTAVMQDIKIVMWSLNIFCVETLKSDIILSLCHWRHQWQPTHNCSVKCSATNSSIGKLKLVSNQNIFSSVFDLFILLLLQMCPHTSNQKGCILLCSSMRFFLLFSHLIPNSPRVVIFLNAGSLCSHPFIICI